MMFASKILVWLITSICFSFGSSYTPQVEIEYLLPGETCEIKPGVLGICQTLTSCNDQDGIFNKEKIHLCASHIGEEYRCCRKPFDIARDLCNAWKSYWRDDEGKCVKKTPLLTSGRNANVGMFPEIAAIGIIKDAKPRWICGGTLVSPHFVLTAAHCVFRREAYCVSLGQHKIYSRRDDRHISRVLGPIPKGLYGERDIHYDARKDEQIEQTMKVQNIIINEEYDPRNQLNDIALLLLKTHAVITARVMPACLPTFPKKMFDDYMMTVAGWGMRMGTTRTRQLHPTLQKFEVPIISSVFCRNKLNELNRNLLGLGLRETHLCGGDHENSVCNGDSGGPLVLQVNETDITIPCEHTIVGIVSFAEGCAKPNVYTRVSKYVDWITSHIAPKMVPLDLPSKKCDNTFANYIRKKISG